MKDETSPCYFSYTSKGKYPRVLNECKTDKPSDDSDENNHVKNNEGVNFPQIYGPGDGIWLTRFL